MVKTIQAIFKWWDDLSEPGWNMRPSWLYLLQRRRFRRLCFFSFQDDHGANLRWEETDRPQIHRDTPTLPTFMHTRTPTPLWIIWKNFLWSDRNRKWKSFRCYQTSCLSTETLSLLEKLNKIKPVWIELGLQTIHEKSAQFIRRGYLFLFLKMLFKSLIPSAWRWSFMSFCFFPANQKKWCSKPFPIWTAWKSREWSCSFCTFWRIPILLYIMKNIIFIFPHWKNMWYYWVNVFRSFVRILWYTD